MYIEIHEWKDFEQKVLYFKLNNALNMNINSELNFKFSGIYAIYKDDICLYVGQSKNLASRIATHIKGKYENFTEIYLWDIEEIGFSDFREKSLDTQKVILTNSEKYLMTKLKPIENLDIDMDFKLPEIKTPNICFDSCSTFTIESNSEKIGDHAMLTITDRESLRLLEPNYTFDYLHSCDKISEKTYMTLKNILQESEIKDFYRRKIMS